MFEAQSKQEAIDRRSALDRLQLSDIMKATDDLPIEIHIQWDDEQGPVNKYFCFDIGFAQTLMEIFREFHKSAKRNCQIKWRDWNKVVDSTGQPVWVMFPW